MVVDRPLTITAAPDRARPVLRSAQPNTVAVTVTAAAADSMIDHLDVRATGRGAVGFDVASAATIDDVTATSATSACLRGDATGLRVSHATMRQTRPGSEPCLQTTGEDTMWDGVTVSVRDAPLAASYSGNAVIIDVTVRGGDTALELGGSPTAHRVTADGKQRGIALSGNALVTDTVAIAGGGGAAVFAGAGDHELVNVTAWGADAGSFGVRAVNSAQILVKNTIARGGSADISAAGQPGSATPGSPCPLPRGCTPGTISVDHSNWRRIVGATDNGFNQHARPRLADPALGDFRLRRGSPAIDKGSFEYNSGNADRAGRFRWLGESPDIGAYEFPSPRPSSRGLDNRRPRLGVVRLTARTFRAGGSGLAFSAARRPRTGTTLVFVMSEDGDFVGLVSRAGKKRSLGAVVRHVGRGTSRIRLSGRLNGKALEPGRYVLTVLGRDVSQNLSRPRRLPFRIAG
jgi:hypothetical protein